MSRRAPRLGGDELAPGPVLSRFEAEVAAAYLEARTRLAPLPPRAERSAMTEAAWQRQIVGLCMTIGAFCYHPKLSRWSASGWPDLSILHGARALWIECKSDSGQLTADQCEVIERMREAGLEVHILRPWHGLQFVADLLTKAG